jgi:hypothetical protein
MPLTNPEKKEKHFYHEMIVGGTKNLLEGNGHSDTELKELLKFYDNAIQTLELLGPEFGLALEECRRRYNILFQYKWSRDYRFEKESKELDEKLQEITKNGS